jgi:hypothetical protein
MIRDGNFVGQLQRSQVLFVSHPPNPHEVGGEEGQGNQDAE